MMRDNLARSFIGPVTPPVIKSGEIVDFPVKSISGNEQIRREQQRIQEEMAAVYWAEKSATPTDTRMQHQPGLFF